MRCCPSAVLSPTFFPSLEWNLRNSPELICFPLDSENSLFILSYKSRLKLITLVNFLEVCIYILGKHLLELTPKKDVLFFIGDWNAKVKSQEILGVTGKFGFRVQNETGQRLTDFPREHTGHSKYPLPTTQKTTIHMNITRWSIPKSDWSYSLWLKMEELYTVRKNETWSWLWLSSWTLYCKIQT